MWRRQGRTLFKNILLISPQKPRLYTQNNSKQMKLTEVSSVEEEMQEAPPRDVVDFLPGPWPCLRFLSNLLLRKKKKSLKCVSSSLLTPLAANWKDWMWLRKKGRIGKTAEGRNGKSAAENAKQVHDTASTEEIVKEIHGRKVCWDVCLPSGARREQAKNNK